MNRLLCSLMLLLCLPAGANAPPMVSAPAGKLQGVASGNVHVFKGIPYATPPVGALRWKPPLPAASKPSKNPPAMPTPICSTPKSCKASATSRGPANRVPCPS